MKRGSNDYSTCMSPTQRHLTPKRACLDISSVRATPQSTGIMVVNLGLPDEVTLAHAEYFLMTGNPKGKVLGCGEQVHTNPADSRFFVRIYNRDFNNGTFKDFVDLEMVDFQEIYSHKSEIEKQAKEVHSRNRKTIVDNGELLVNVGPSFYGALPAKVTVEIEKKGKKSTMYVETFGRMMSYSLEINNVHSEFCRRHGEDLKIYEEIVNAIAYVRNDNRANAYIRQPEIGRKSGLLTTCAKIVEQARKVVSMKEV